MQPSPSSSSLQDAPSSPRRRGAPTGAARPAPGPKGLPVVGNVPRIVRQGLFRFVIESAREHGDAFRIGSGGTSQLIISHPDAMERVLASNRTAYVKGSGYDVVRDLLGHNLITLEGDAWKKRRRLAQPSFHRRTIAGLVDAMAELSISRFDELRRSSPRGTVLEMHREMTGLTLDIVVEALFGRGLSREADTPYEVLSAALLALSDRGNGFPLPKWIPTSSNRRFQHTLTSLNADVHKLILAARRRLDAGDEPSTLLGMLLSTRDDDTGEALHDEELRDEVKGLFVAGHETTALTMTWLFTLLDGQHDVMERMRAEVDDVLGGRAPTYEDIPRLSYLRQVVDEALRLRPAAWIIARNAVRDDELCGIAVKEGDLVVPCIYLTHRHPDYWPDAERFDPDRFSPENQKARDNWAYLPFSGGPRVCIGNTFSLVETQVLLATLLQRFSFELLPGQRIEPKAVGTLRPSGPVYVRLDPR